jgi:hypothetical protein
MHSAVAPPSAARIRRLLWAICLIVGVVSGLLAMHGLTPGGHELSASGQTDAPAIVHVRDAAPVDAARSPSVDPSTCTTAGCCPAPAAPGHDGQAMTCVPGPPAPDAQLAPPPVTVLRIGLFAGPAAAGLAPTGLAPARAPSLHALSISRT